MSERLSQMWNGRSRAAVLIFGGLLVLQSSGEFDVVKVAYFVVAVVCVIGSFRAVWLDRASGQLRPLHGLLVVSTVLAGLVAVSLPIALGAGTPFQSWLRDATNYGLAASIPIVAFDLYRSSSRQFVLALLLIAGGVATASYAIEWLDARRIATLPIGRLALASGHLTSALFVALIALSFAARRGRLAWAAAVGVVMATFISVGSRGRIPFALLAPFLAVIGRPLGVKTLAPSLVVQFVVTLASVGLLYTVLVGGLLLDGAPGPRPEPPASPVPTGPPLPNPLLERFGSLPELITNLGSDPSLRERVSQTLAAWDVFAAQPILGSGPGRAVFWENYLGETVSSYNLDTPILVAAKFGVVGALVMGWWTVAVIGLLSRAARDARTTWPGLMVAGFAVIIPYSWLLVPPLEDKGLSFALMLLIPLGLGVLAPARGADDPTSLIQRTLPGGSPEHPAGLEIARRPPAHNPVRDQGEMT